ncbi:MAG: HD domain-containing protein [Candidatus Wildermuthbacteria bacterium]|nr:HD domain-containing protein [Candidatus Wildermuthbacteria bacterium]
MKIPQEVEAVMQTLSQGGFEAAIVGGCVRDLLSKREPEDWDVATNASPEEIQKLFPENFYDNKFFTVTVKTGSEKPKLKEIEVTTYRTEFKYIDRRRPTEVRYAETLEEDLSRRDFTMNAIALRKKGKEYEIIDPFEGQKDLKAKLIRAVGEASERFQEDALRMLRAVRFFATLGFALEPSTRAALQKHASLLGEISQERIREEFLKIVMSERALEALEELRELGLLSLIIPELLEGFGITQNKHHIYTVYEHNIRSLQFAASKNWSLEVRVASLLHDVGKPKVKIGEGSDSTFHGHDVVGSRMVQKILSRLRFPQKTVEKVAKLVRYHMFYYNVGEVTEYSVRKLVRNIGKESIEELLQLRQADRIGSGVPKAEPYKLRHLRYMLEKVSQDPIGAKMLGVKGNDIMEKLKIGPGPKVGQILDILLEEVLEDPKKNGKTELLKRVGTLGKLSNGELQKLSAKARKERTLVATKRDEMTKQKYWVT